MPVIYHAKRRIASPWCSVPEDATLPHDIPANILRRWLKDGVIAKGRGDRNVDFIEDTGRVDEDDEFNEDEDVDIESPDDFPLDDDGLDDEDSESDDDDETTVPAPADTAEPPKPKPARKTAAKPKPAPRATRKAGRQ